MTPRRQLSLLAFAVGAAVIVFAGYRAYTGQRAVLTRTASDELQGVAAVKAAQVATWRGERLADLRVLAANVELMPAIGAVLDGTAAPAQAAAVQARLEMVRSNYRYGVVVLTDGAGTIRAATGEPFAAPRHYRALAAEAGAGGQVIRDFPQGPDVSTPHVALATAVRTGGAIAGAVILAIDPRATFLAATLQWPRSTTTGEVLLVRRDGEDALYLGGRQRQVAVREPLTDVTRPVARALLGRDAAATGVDADGVVTLSASAPVAESPWVVVARIDQAEALSPVRDYAMVLTGIGAGLVLVLGLALAWLRRYQVAQFYRRQYEVEAERRRLLTVHEQERQQLEEQLRESQRLESIGRLAGGVAHDFNNLLTVINGYGDLLASRLAGDPELNDLATQVVKAGDRAAALTQQLLAFSRRQMTEPRVLGLNALVADAEPMLGRLAGDAVGLVIETNAAPDRVVADPGQLHQILVNLAVNARDAMPQGGRLTIETLTVDEPAGDTAAAGVVPGRSVVVRVSDTGVGMDEAVQARIFEPFFTTKAIGRGTGLGLATVYGIVKHWGGRIRVKSAPGAGTTFDVSLPLTDAPLPVDRPVRRPPPHRGSETVLVVEDRDDVRRLVVRALRACGYQVVEAASGMEAIATSDAHGGPIDLLLTDVVMPGLNGRQLATRLRQQRPGLLVLYMSGYSDERLGDGDELDAGTNYIQKPFTPDDLAARVRAILGQSDGLRRLLVVDAEPAIRALFQRLLASSGCDVLLAADAAEALDIIEGVAQVDVVVIDLDALAPAGRLAAIRERLPAAKAIVMSAAFGAEWRAGAGPMGADAILAKPIDADRLYDALLDVITPGDAADPAAREVARGDATR